MYNEIHIEAPCPTCYTIDKRVIQFKFGHTYHLVYQVGDRLAWDGNNVGLPSLGRVVVAGISGPCEACGVRFQDYIVQVERDVIAGVQAADEGSSYITNGKPYKVLIE